MNVAEAQATGVIGCVGVGAIGGVCAARLALASAHREDLVLCVRRPFERLVVQTPDARLECAPRVVTDVGEWPPGESADWILLATKAHQTVGAAPWLRALSGETTRVAVLQNGVEHVERLTAHVERERILPVVVACPAVATAPGRVEQRAAARLFVPSGEAGRAFAALFAGTDLRVDLEDDFTTTLWRKLCLNVTGGAIAALAGRALPEITHPEREAMARALAAEAVAVGRAEGARLTASLAAELAAGAAGARTGGSPSTLTDRLAGRPLEIDARNGAVVRIGARHGIPTPANARAVALLRDAHEDPQRDLLDAFWEGVRGADLASRPR